MPEPAATGPCPLWATADAAGGFGPADSGDSACPAVPEELAQLGGGRQCGRRCGAVPAGAVPCASYAKEHSFYSQLMQMPAATLYCVQILPVILPLSALRRWDCYSSFRPRRYSAAVPENWRIRQKRRPFSERPERPVWFFSAFYTDFTKIISFSTSFSLAVLQRMW